jgi:NRPS condensation-like uncharacterized protein
MATLVLESLPTSPLEDAIIDSERHDYPMVTVLELWVDGTVDRGRLSAALRQVAQHHAMASARLAPIGLLDCSRHWERVHTFDIDPVSDLGELDRAAVNAARDEMLSTSVPLDVAPPFRLAVASVDGGSVVMLAAHHGAFDGTGGIALLRWVAAAYCGASLPVNPADPQLELSRRSEILNRRGSRRGASPSPRPLTRLRRIGTLAVSAAGPAARIEPRGVLQATVTSQRSATRRTVQWAKVVDAPGPVPTGNDLLLSALHLAIQDWNSSAGLASGRITLTVPVATRSPDERGRFVANLTIQASTSTTMDMRRDPANLVAEVRTQTARIKDEGLADEPAAWLGVPWLPVRLRRALPRVASRLGGDRLLASSRLSNLGHHEYGEFATDEFRVRHVWFYPPVRMPQGVVIGATTMSSAVHLAFCWSRAQFDQQRGDAFADLYCRSLERFEPGVVRGGARTW